MTYNVLSGTLSLHTTTTTSQLQRLKGESTGGKTVDSGVSHCLLIVGYRRQAFQLSLPLITNLLCRMVQDTHQEMRYPNVT